MSSLPRRTVPQRTLICHLSHLVSGLLSSMQGEWITRWLWGNRPMNPTLTFQQQLNMAGRSRMGCSNRCVLPLEHGAAIVWYAIFSVEYVIDKRHIACCLEVFLTNKWNIVWGQLIIDMSSVLLPDSTTFPVRQHRNVLYVRGPSFPRKTKNGDRNCHFNLPR